MSTLRAKLKEKKRRQFTNRENEISLFLTLLEATEPEYNILAIHGMAGVGKSTLLGEFERICAEREVLVVRIDGSEHKSAMEILKVIRQHFGERLEAFSDSDENFERYLQLRRQLHAEGTIEPEIDVLYGIVTKPEADFYLNAQSILAEKLLTSLEAVTETRFVVLIDSYEKISELDDWVRNGIVANLPENVVVAISGREELKGRWEEWRPLIKSIELLSFDHELTREYLRKRGVEEKDLIEEIFKFTQGHPLCLALSADLTRASELTANNFVKEPQKFVIIDSLIERIMQQLSSPLMRSVLEVCAVVRYFNEDVLDYMSTFFYFQEGQLQSISDDIRALQEQLTIHKSDLGHLEIVRAKYGLNPPLDVIHGIESERQQIMEIESKLEQVGIGARDGEVTRLFDQLQEYSSFIYQRGDGLALHDTVRRYLIEEVRRRSPERFEMLNQRALDFYESREEGAEGHEKQKLLLEILYHRLTISEQDGVDFFVKVFEEKIKLFELDFCESLINEVKSYRPKLNQSKVWMAFCEARLQYHRGKWEEAAGIYQELLRAASLEEHLQLATSVDLGIVFRQLNKLDESIFYLNQGLKLAEATANESEACKALSGLGYAHCRRGDLDKAVSYFLESIKLARKLGDGYAEAQALNEIGNPYTLLGQYDEALECHSQALQIARRLGNRFLEGSSLYYLGTAYRYKTRRDHTFKDLAIENLQKGAAILEDLGHSQQQAVCISCLGSVYSYIGMYHEAIESLIKCISIFEDVGDSFERAVAQEKLGLVYGRLGDWQKAINYYQESLPVAQQGKNEYFKCEILKNLCKAYYGLGNDTEFKRYFGEALEIARDNGFFYLLTELNWVSGDSHFGKHDYEAFFSSYCEACLYSVQIGRQLFEETVERITDYVHRLINSNRHSVAMEFYETLEALDGQSELLDGVGFTQELQQLRAHM